MATKIVHTSGKRKQAIARATLKPGTGKITVNNIILEVYQPKMYRMKIMEPVILVDKIASKVNVNIKVKGGGMNSQAEAARLALSKAYVQYSKDDKLRKLLLAYDRQLLVADVRLKETCKPNDSKARAKRQKSYR